MPIVYLTRKSIFCASHRLHCPELSDLENQQVFGKCNLPNGHGHNYVLKVTIRGRPDPRTGILMNMSELKRIIEESILDRMDHKHLNLDVPEFSEVNPTAENLVVVIWAILSKKLNGNLLHEVTVHETENNSSTYRGE